MAGGGKFGVPVTDHVVLPQQAVNETTPVATERPPFRFVFVDGLRGLAALAIVVFHIWWYEPEPYPAFEYSHWIVDATFRRIRVAVQVLLVISGFVVAYTLRKTWVTPRELFWFLGRRLVRLIPPYWVTIGVIILVDTLCQRIWNLTSPVDGPLSLHRVSAHMTFMQDILGHDALSAGMWTICIEMQFYVVAIFAWGLAQRIAPRPAINEPKPSVWGLLAVFVPAALASLFYWRSLESTSPWVIHFFWMFFLGMMTWWTLDRTLPTFIFAMIISVGVAELAFNSEWWHQYGIAFTTAQAIPEESSRNPSHWYQNAFALTAAVLIFTAGRIGTLETWLNWRWLQYVGRISYSLYLIHFPVCHLLTAAGWKWCHNSPTPIQADAILLASLIASLMAAHILYTFVEVPANRWAAWMKQFAEASPRIRANASGG